MKFLIALTVVSLASVALAMSPPIFNLPVCTKYVNVLVAYVQCSSFNKEVGDPLLYLQQVCSNRTAIETCMLNQVSSCTNKQAIMDGISTNLNKCDGNEVQQSLVTYFNQTYIDINECDINYNYSSEIACMMLSVSPLTVNTTYEEGQTLITNYFNRFPVCFASFMNRGTLEECGQRSGYRLMVDNLAYSTILPFPGADFYELFLNIQTVE